jgi:CBS domain-containing protein
MLARSAAAVPAPPPMEREAIRRSVIAVRTIGAILPVRTIAALPVLRRLMLLLTAGDERRQPFHVAAFVVGRMLLARLKVLRLVILLLIVMLLTRIVRLRLARCERFAAAVRLLGVAVVETLVGATHLARLLLLVIRLALAELFLRGGDQPEIVLGMLIIIFRGDRISGALRVAGQLKVFLGDVGGRSSNFDVLPVGFVHARQRILVVMTTLPVTPAHTFVLTVSHGLLFCQPPFCATARKPPLRFTEFCSKAITTAPSRSRSPL